MLPRRHMQVLVLVGVCKYDLATEKDLTRIAAGTALGASLCARLTSPMSP